MSELPLITLLTKTKQIVSQVGLHKIIPARKKVYDALLGLAWPKNKNTIDIQGSKMYVDVFDPDPSMRETFRAYAFNRIHEEFTTNLFKRIVKKGDTVVDMGANIGYFSLLAASLVGKGGKVFSFEPEPRNFKYLSKNIALNGYNQVTVNQKAVGEAPGKVKLYICPYDTGHHTIQQFGGIESYRPDTKDMKKDFVEVDKVKLDDYLNEKRAVVNIIKMDVEGAEMLALSGMKETIRKSENLAMVIEFFPLLIKNMGQSSEEFIRTLLNDFQLTMYVIGHDYSMESHKLTKDFIKVNSIKDVLDLCSETNDHLNLFLVKGSKYASIPDS